MTTLVTDEDCDKLLSMTAAISVIEEVFRMAGDGMVENPPRFRMPSKEGQEFQFGMAKLHAKNMMGFKVGSPQTRRWNFLYSMETHELLAILQARVLSKLRTGATSAVAAKYLSPSTASIIGMYGTGRQAEAQLEAICAVRPIQEAHVYSRDQAKREAFSQRMSKQLNIKVVAVQAPEHVPRAADIIVTMTNSVTPVLFGEWMSRPGLVLCVGANHTFDREIDEELVKRAKLVVVDELKTSKSESGDLLRPVAHGLLRWDQVEDLGDVVAGRARVPDFSSGIIIFESHGLAMEDVAIAARAYELARAQGLGREISL